jgi:hypothetical protein
VQGISPSCSATSGNGHGGLSTGAKAGIAVGIVARLFIMLLVMAFFILQRRMRNRKQALDRIESRNNDPITSTKFITRDTKSGLDPMIAIPELDVERGEQNLA